MQWIPFTLAWDDHVPIDISFVFEHEKPAGKHGFLTVAADRFGFEDGAEARFWGTCFNSGQNFPSHEDAEMVARRLAKFGCNIVRTHQMDAEWATPNIFQFNRAQPQPQTRTFDPESIDRLDYLIYCLKQQGIYVYLDMLTYRQFRPDDGVDRVDRLGQAAKPYTYFDPKLIELQKEFARDLWSHTNPYTKLAYKDDPAIALTGIKNESDLFTQHPISEPYRSQLEEMYRDWAKEKALKVAPTKIDFAAPGDQEAQISDPGDAGFLCRYDYLSARDLGSDSNCRDKLESQSRGKRRTVDHRFHRFPLLFRIFHVGKRVKRRQPR